LHRRICFSLGRGRQSRGQLAAVWGRKEHCESSNRSEDRGRSGGIEDNEQAGRRKDLSDGGGSAVEDKEEGWLRFEREGGGACRRNDKERCARPAAPAAPAAAPPPPRAEGMIRSAEDEVC